MKILFDIGNSSIDWAIEEEQKFIVRDRFNYDVNKLSEQLEQVIYTIDDRQPTAILVSNVADNNLIEIVQAWANKRWQLVLWQAEVRDSFGKLKNSYSEPLQMGIDRWLAMIAAWCEYETALCVIDCGTALTIDVIENSGKHMGGYIMPGVAMMQQMLIQSTENINVSVAKQISIEHANNTQDAISHGACLATVATINYVLSTLNTESKCIITGGMAESIQTLVQHPFKYAPNLVLRGLSIAHEGCQ